MTDIILLHLRNNQDLYDIAMSLAGKSKDVNELSQLFYYWFTKQIDQSNNTGWISDILNKTVDSVDWIKVANEFKDDYDDSYHSDFGN